MGRIVLEGEESIATEKHRSMHQTWLLEQEAGANILNHKHKAEPGNNRRSSRLLNTKPIPSDRLIFSKAAFPKPSTRILLTRDCVQTLEIMENVSHSKHRVVHF